MSVAKPSAMSIPAAHESESVVTRSPTLNVRVLAFNRPAKRNALSNDLISRFLLELRKASADPQVKAIIVTGTDAVFSAGADIKDIARLDSQAARECRYLEDLCNGMRAVKVPLIAAVEGMALGGGFEIALMCDIIVSSSTAKFGFPEVKIGLIPGAGGTQRLTSAVGKYRAMSMILLGEPLTSQDAATLGLVSYLCSPNTVLDNAVRIALQFAEQSSSATELAKAAINRADDLGRDDEFERSLYWFSFGTKDKAEGVSAFLDKRQPRWQ